MSSSKQEQETNTENPEPPWREADGGGSGKLKAAPSATNRSHNPSDAAMAARSISATGSSHGGSAAGSSMTQVEASNYGGNNSKMSTSSLSPSNGSGSDGDTSTDSAAAVGTAGGEGKAMSSKSLKREFNISSDSTSSGDESFQRLLVESGIAMEHRNEMGKDYAGIKREYRETALVVAMQSIQVQGGRFLEKDRSGEWKDVPKDAIWKRFKKEFKQACRDLENDGEESNYDEEPELSKPVMKSASLSATAAVPASSEINVQKPQPGSNMSFQRLVVDGAGSDRDEAHKFAKGLGLNSNLTSLEIQLRSLTGKLSEVDKLATLNTLASGLRSCRRLEQVKLQYEDTSFDSIATVLIAILENPSIESLNLDGNDIDGNSMRILCKLLLGCPSTQLMRLSLQYNPFGDIGATALHEVIMNNRSLRYLCLRENMLSRKGASLLQQAKRSKRGYLFEVSGLNVSSGPDRVEEPPLKKQRTLDSAALRCHNSDDDNSGSNSGSDDHKSSLSGYGASEDGHNGDHGGSGSNSSREARNGSSTSSTDDRSGNSSGSENA
ncbi:MAG: hypothetical protein SGILL_005602 [Bacillariaceae sp.]